MKNKIIKPVARVVGFPTDRSNINEHHTIELLNSGLLPLGSYLYSTPPDQRERMLELVEHLYETNLYIKSLIDHLDSLIRAGEKYEK